MINKIKYDSKTKAFVSVGYTCNAGKQICKQMNEENIKQKSKKRKKGHLTILNCFW